MSPSSLNFTLSPTLKSPDVAPVGAPVVISWIIFFLFIISISLLLDITFKLSLSIISIILTTASP